MAIGMIIGTIGSVLSNVVKGFFGIKQAQATAITTALQVLSDVNASDAVKAQAAAMAIAADARSESVLTRMWRPMVMFMFLGLIISYWFGYAPENLLSDEMPPLLGRIFDIVEIVVLAGYPARTLEKIAREMNIGRILTKFVDKVI